MEYISLEGLRVDGRRANEIRNIYFKLDLFRSCSGSAYYEQGNTKVVAVVYGPKAMTKKKNQGQMNDDAIINCEYSMATFSTGERKSQTKGDRRSIEISMMLRKTFESVIEVNKYPRSQIDLFMYVLQADGGTRCACVNAATLALMDAGIAMKDMVVACAAGYIDDTAVCDLNYVEDSSGSVDVPIAYLPRSGDLQFIQMDAKIPKDHFESVLNMAIHGATCIHAYLQKKMKDMTFHLASNQLAPSQQALLSKLPVS